MIASKVEQNNLKAAIGASYNKLYGQFSSNELKEVGNYKILKQVGEGSFGKVYLANHKLTHQKVVLKTGEKKDPNVVREVFYHRQFDFPFITKLYEVIVTESKVWMALEYCPGNELYDYLLQKQRIPLDETSKLFAQIVGAVFYAHSLQCVHRDLKLENILLDKQGYAMLTDFGFTRECATKTQLETICGTTVYMAPELIKRESYDGYKVDTWSLGIILYTMLHGFMPFDEEDPTLTGLKIMNEMPPIVDAYTNVHAKDLILKLLRKTPSERPSLNKVLEHPFLQPYGTILLDTIDSLIKRQRQGDVKFQSKTEKRLLKRLKQTGFDTAAIKISVTKRRCDALCSLWYLLLEKEKKKELLKHPRKSRSGISVRKVFDSASGMQSQDEFNYDKATSLRRILSIRSETSSRPPLHIEIHKKGVSKQNSGTHDPSTLSQESITSSSKSKISILQKFTKYFSRSKRQCANQQVKEQSLKNNQNHVFNNFNWQAKLVSINNSNPTFESRIPDKRDLKAKRITYNKTSNGHRLRGALTIQEPNLKNVKPRSSGEISGQVSSFASETEANVHSTPHTTPLGRIRPSSMLSQHSTLSNDTFNSEYSTDAQSTYKSPNSLSAKISGLGQLNGGNTGDSGSLTKSKIFAKRAVSIMSSASSTSEISSRADSFYDITTASSPVNLDVRVNPGLTPSNRIDSAFPGAGSASSSAAWLSKRENTPLFRRPRVNVRSVKRNKMIRGNSTGTQSVIQEESSFSDGDQRPMLVNSSEVYERLDESVGLDDEVAVQTDSVSSKAETPIYPITLNSGSKSADFTMGRSFSDGSEWSQNGSFIGLHQNPASGKQIASQNDEHEDLGMADHEDNS